ncbi:MAG: TatD family hydrolase [Oscillospiraceae bacterium]
MFFDTHAHYDDERFDADRDELLAGLPEAGVELVLNPGCDEPTSRAAVALAEKFDHVYAAVGWHPHEADSYNDESAALIRRWAAHPKVKAIGEIGLDYFYDFSPREKQREVFAAQLALAKELALPVIIHDRDAHGECMEIIGDCPGVRGVFHCYSGSAEMARRLLDMGWYLSFTGAITFKNARKALEAIAVCPLDRIMIETDSPYLAPVPHRGERNDSRMLPYMAQVIADVKGISPEEAARITLENGRRFFGI